MKRKIAIILTVLLVITNLTPVQKVMAVDFSVNVSPISSSARVNTNAIFTFTITNNCTQPNVYNVSLQSALPPGWTVVFSNDQFGTNLLADSNGDGIPDTGTVNSGAAKDIYILIKPSSLICNNNQENFTIRVQGTNSYCGNPNANYIDSTISVTSINEGNLIILKEVNPEEGKVGDIVTWTIKIRNSGSDPIGNVHIVDTLGSGISEPSNFNFNPEPSSGSFPNWVYGEIPAGSEYVIQFTTTISECSNAYNEVEAWWGINENNKCQTQHVLQSVKIIPTIPSVQYDPPSISVPYCGSANVSIPITNNGNGFAKNFKLKIDNFPNNYQISNIGANWSYDSLTSEFTYLGGNPPGTINPNQTVILTFTVSMPQGECSVPSTTLKFFTEYDDPCNNHFMNPSQLGSISVSGTGSYFTINKSGPDPVDIGDTNRTYTISVTYHKGNCQNDSVVVDIVDDLPTPFIPQSASEGGQINGQQVKWDNITLQDGVTRNLSITFNVSNDPCFAGNEYTNIVNLTGPNGETLTDCCSCPIANTSATWSTFVNNPALAILNSSKEVNPSSIEIDCSSDTGLYTNPSGNLDLHNERRYTVEFDFNTGNYAPSSWNGIMFRDNLDNNQYTNSLIANIDIQVDCGSGYQSVYGWIVNSYVPLEINLSGLQACAPNTGAKLKISFTARATQTNDLNNSESFKDYIDWSTLEIPGFPRGCSNDPKYYEGVRVRDFRANLVLSTNFPQVVGKCNIYDLTLNFERQNANVDHTDLVLTLNGFTYVPNSTTYSNGGSWCSGTKGEPTINGNQLIWSWQQINEITSNGSITIKVKKDCSNNASVSVNSNYLDNCGKSHTASTSASSTLITSAKLYTKITPQLNFAYAHTVDWKVFVSNGGDGVAREITLITQLGSGLSFNSNGAYVKNGNTTYNYGDPSITWPSNGSTGTLTWDLGNLEIAPSNQIEVYFKTDINTCSENNLTVEAYSNWCSSLGNCQESNHDSGQVKLPTSYALVTISSANFYMCSGGDVEISIKNPGSTHIYNVVSHAYLPKYIKYKNNSAQYSYNGGVYQTASNPTINSVSGGDYDGGYELIFNSLNIQEFLDLYPGDEIKIKFQVEPDDKGGNQPYPSCNFLKGTFKKIKSFAEFAKPCDIESSTEISNIYEKDFTTYAPKLSVTKNVIEINSVLVSPVPYFPQELGKEVLFEIKLANVGNSSTIKTNFADVLKAPNRHPLILQNAEYSYDGSTFSSVPWTVYTDDANNTIYIWNNIESTLGHGIEPGKTLTIRLRAKVDSNCTPYAAHEISEVWTGCGDLYDMGFYGQGKDLLQWTDGAVWNGLSGDLPSATCPIYQAKFARTYGHKDSWAVVYSSNIQDDVSVCDKNIPVEISFKNGTLQQGATTIYAPIEIWDVIPRGANYVTGTSEILIPGSTSWISLFDPSVSTITFSGSELPFGNGSFTLLKWNLSNNPLLSLIDLQPEQEIKLRFKIDLGDCGGTFSYDLNRERLIGKDCSGTLTYYFPAGSEQGLDWWEKDHWPFVPDHPWVKELHIMKPNISIEKTVDKSFASPGDTLLFMIRIKNAGDGASKNFKVTEAIPSGLIIDPFSITDGPPPGWGNSYSWMTHFYDVNTNTITWESNSGPNYEFPSGAETTVLFKAIVSTAASGDIINSVKYEDSCCYSGNNVLYSQTSIKITSTPIRVLKSIVEVNGNPVSEPVRTQPGDIVRFRIKIENRGSLPIYNVDVYDTLPQGLVYQPGSSRYAITNGSDPTAWIQSPDPNTSPYQTPPQPPPGFSGYQWHIQQNLLGTDDNGGSAGGNLDTLYLEFLAKVTTDAPASPIGYYLLNRGDTASTQDQEGNNPTTRDVIDTSNATAWILNYKPELLIMKSVVSVNDDVNNTAKGQPGDIVLFKIEVKNTSAFATAVNVNVSDTLPSGFNYIVGSTSAAWSGGSSSIDPVVVGHNINFNYNATIKANESLTILFKATITSDAVIGKNTNSASAQGQDKDGGSISATAPDGSGQTSCSLNVYKPVLRATKIPQSDIATIGSPVTFIVKVENLDSYARAQNINITDTLPSGWTYVSGSSYKVINNGTFPTNWGSPISNPSGTQTLTWNLGETLYGTDDQGKDTGTANDTLWLKFDATPTNSALGCANKDTISVSYNDYYNTSQTPVSAEANVCVCSPKLEMEKTSNLTTARVNEEVTFTLKISNKNPVDALHVNVHDYLPVGWEYVANSGRYQRTNGSTPLAGSWTNVNPTISGSTLIFNTNITIEGTDDNGGSSGTKLDTLFIEFRVKPTQNANHGTNVNRAVAEGVDSGNNPIGSNEGDVVINVQKPEITITKTVDKQSANVGDTLTYTITVTNTGNLDLINATITDTLPDGVAYVSSSGGTYTPPNIVTFSNLTIPANGNIQKTITVKIKKNLKDGTILTNSAKIDGSDSYGNNYSIGPTTAQTTVKAPDLIINKSSSPNPVKAGENITYTITLTNTGSAAANNIIITDNVPTNTTFVSADNNGQNINGVITWNVGTLNANDSITVHFIVKVNSPIPDNTTITNTATVNSDEQGPVASNETINVVSSVPQLLLCKSDSQDPVKPGNTFNYTIRYANNSTMDITNVVITDTLPNGLVFISSNPNPTSVVGQVITWNIGNLGAGSSGNITLTVRVDGSVANGTLLTNIVRANSNETPEATATEDTLIGTLPSLSISKKDNIDPVPAGQNIVYTIKYQNTGGQTATGVVITDTLPNGVIYVSSNPQATTVNGNTLTWNIGNLSAGASGQIEVTVYVPVNTANGTQFTNSVSISSNETNPVFDTETTTVQSAPALTIAKEVTTTHSPAQAGDDATYTITYGNSGNLTATNTVVTDKLPLNTRFIVGSATQPLGITVEYSNDNGVTWSYTPVNSGDGTDPNVTDIRWIIGNLAPGTTNQQITFKVRLNTPLPNGTVISNTATITCAETSPLSSSKEFPVGSSPVLHINKTSSANSVQAGETFTYTIEYWNTGNMDATGVVITETYDTNITFVSATPAPDAGTNNIWTIGNLSADGSHHTITITVTAKSPLPNGTVIHNVATIDSDQTNPQQVTKDVTIGSAPVLTINKNDTPDPVIAGDNIIYTITVGNTGNAPATGVVVTDETPANTTFVSARFISGNGTITDPGVGNVGLVTWSLSGSLSPNEDFVVELVVKTNKPFDNGAVIHNEARVICLEDQQGKVATQDTTIKSSPLLSIIKKDVQDPVSAGDNITYMITISNSGNMNAHNVVVTDVVPNNTTFVSASFVTGSGTIVDPGVGNTGTVTWTLSGTLEIGNSIIVELVVKTASPLPNGTQIQNTASVVSEELQSPISVTETTTIGSSPNLKITKTASPSVVFAGQNITYTIKVQNIGNMNATNFIITDSVPANTTFVSARFVSGGTGTINAPLVGETGIVEWIPIPDTLGVNSTIIVELVVKTANSLPAGTTIKNTAYADSSQTQQVSATALTTVSSQPVLTVLKSVYPLEQAPKGIVIYSIKYLNVGNAPATNVRIEEVYPLEVEFYYSNPQPSINNNIWIIPRLEANQEGYITIAVKVKENVPLISPPLKVVNTVKISCSEQQIPVYSNASFEVKAPNFFDPAHVIQRKEVSPSGNVTPGTWLTYTNYFGNSGNAPATNVVITDPLDSNLDETTLAISDGNIPGTTHVYDSVRREIRWIIPILQPGENGYVSFKVMVRATLNGYTIITNTSKIKSDQNPESVNTNTVYNTVVAPCPVCPTPSPTPTPTPSPTPTPTPTPSPTPTPTPTPPTPPEPAYSINLSINVPEIICASSIQKYVFTFTNGVSPYSYEIDFGDGTMKIQGEEKGNFVTLEHIYLKSGKYTIFLKVSDKNGKAATLSHTIEVKDCVEEISVYHHNFIIGYPDNTVRPERNVSRGEVAAMILRALGINVNRISDDIRPFKDIPVTHWAYNFTRQIYLEGLMQGDEKGNFNVDRFATRAEIATVLVRLKGLSPDYSDPLFSDTEKGKWYTPYINQAVKAGLITGYPDKTFKPNNNVTRAEFVAMLERALYRTDVTQVKNFTNTESIIKWKDITSSHWAYYIMLEAWQPHILMNVSVSDMVIKVKSKTIPVYLPKSNSVIEFPEVGSTIRSIIVPVDGAKDSNLPSPRSVVVKIINTEAP